MPLEFWLDDRLMQAIAGENNLSETAFTVPSESGDADYELRWFTPTTEVDSVRPCDAGDRARAAAGERIRFSTRSGTLTVTRDGDLLQLDLPASRSSHASLDGLLEALGVGERTFP